MFNVNVGVLLGKALTGNVKSSEMCNNTTGNVTYTAVQEHLNALFTKFTMLLLVLRTLKSI